MSKQLTFFSPVSNSGVAVAVREEPCIHLHPNRRLVPKQVLNQSHVQAVALKRPDFIYYLCSLVPVVATLGGTNFPNANGEPLC